MRMMDSEPPPVPWTDEELRSNIGQLFIVGFHGHIPSEDIKTLISAHKVGAIILFERNIRDAKQLRELTKSLQDIAKQTGHKQDLFIGIDQENGLVTRIKEPITVQLPGAMALAATQETENAYKVATATAEMLRSFGVNFNYAPVADVNSERKNPVISVRSPSDDPEMVGRFVSAQVKGLQNGGVVPCVKHFPGHGDTTVDSHYGLPVIKKSKAELDICELIPFRRAVMEGVNAVMTAHIALSSLGGADDDTKQVLPASLNPEVIEILREEMKYDGLVISDCLEMDGVRATFGTKSSATRALKAGSDCLMICHTADVQMGAIEQIINAVKSGELSQGSIQKSVNRIQRLKAKYLSSTASIVVGDWKDMIDRHTKLVAEIYAKSTTVARSEPGCLPVPKTITLEHVVFIRPTGGQFGGGIVDEDNFQAEHPDSNGDAFRNTRTDEEGSIEIIFKRNTPLSSEAESYILDAEVVILATRNAHLNSYQKEFGLSLGKRLGKKLIVVATCDPHDFLEDEKEVKNYIVVYEPTLSAWHSALDVIFGRTKAIGKLPLGKKKPSISGIRSYDGTERDSKHIWDLWQRLFPAWPIELTRLRKLLNVEFGKHFINQKGFCIAYNCDGMAKISAVGVLPEARGKGLGTALMARAQEELRANGKVESFGIGSVFPRFWAGLPLDLPQEYKDFFLHRGFRYSTKPTARDLYRNITVGVAPDEIIEKVSKLHLRFAPWSPEQYEECMRKQRENFSYNHAWIKAYERLAAANQHHEVMVAYDPETNTQIGWTLMCSHSAIICDDFAFLPLTPAKDKTGLIACVGVDKAARGKGVGLALLVKAMENMRKRGVQGVLIDWVVIRGFYENLGFSQIWEYDGYDW